MVLLNEQSIKGADLRRPLHMDDFGPFVPDAFDPPHLCSQNCTRVLMSFMESHSRVEKFERPVLGLTETDYSDRIMIRKKTAAEIFKLNTRLLTHLKCSVWNYYELSCEIPHTAWRVHRKFVYSPSHNCRTYLLVRYWRPEVVKIHWKSLFCNLLIRVWGSRGIRLAYL